MNSQQGGNGFDAWTGMPTDFEDIDLESLSLSGPSDQFTAAAIPAAQELPPAAKRNGIWNITDLFWKLMAAGSHSTPTSVLDCLATDTSPRVRKSVAENRNAPADALSLLASDQDPAVRAAVAKNPSTPLFLLRQLASDDNVDVRFAIASNAEMPDAILLSLFLDPDPFVAHRASQTLAA